MRFDGLSIDFDPTSPEATDAKPRIVRLSDLKGYFADTPRYEALVAADDPVVYRVSSWQVASNDGDLMCGFGTLMPGRVGDEYFLTKGHYHEWREAAEIYIGLSGDGYMLLEDEHSDDSRMVPLRQNSMVYVPGHTAHRTINIGPTPLTYIGIYPATAGHDYGSLSEENFRHVVVAENDTPVLKDRLSFLQILNQR